MARAMFSRFLRVEMTAALCRKYGGSELRVSLEVQMMQLQRLIMADCMSEDLKLLPIVITFTALGLSQILQPEEWKMKGEPS